MLPLSGISVQGINELNNESFNNLSDRNSIDTISSFEFPDFTIPEFSMADIQKGYAEIKFSRSKLNNKLALRMDQSLDQVAPKKIAYLWSNDNELTPSFITYLEGQGFIADAYLLGSLSSETLSTYDLILIGRDTGFVDNWGTDADVAAVSGSNVPVVGIGEGGYAYFGQLGLEIGARHGWHGSGHSIIVYDTAHPIFNGIPYDEETGLIDVHDPERQPTGFVAINRDGTDPDANTNWIAHEIGSDNHFIFSEQDEMYFLWGFDSLLDPSFMTTTGQQLFLNSLRYMIEGGPPPAIEAPVVISSDDDFGEFASSGSGSADDPWIIEGLTLEHATQDLLTISGTRDYFIVRDSSFNGLSGSANGIVLNNVENGVITGSDIFANGLDGIVLINSNFNSISFNNIYDNGGNGIFFVNSHDNVINDNYVYGNGWA
ncbi:MAG: right-handed parallel beta-helix repeat-containing protein, partial [Candidatus Kariarchaeaceae archaeon]